MPLSLLDRSPLGILILTPDGVVRRANPAARSLFAYPAEELIGKGIRSLIRQWSGERTGDSERGSLPRRLGEQDLRQAMKIDGSLIPIEVGVWPLPDSKDTLVLLRDVTERQRANELWLHADEINRTAHWTYDLGTDVVYWSPELFRILRLPHADTAPPYETHHTLFSPESWARLEPAVARASEHGEPYELELELARRDADDLPRFAVARCEPICNVDGSVHRLVGTFQDVTDQVRTRQQRDRLLERFSLAKSAAGIGVWDWNVESDRLVWDDRMYELYGVEKTSEPTTFATWQGRVSAYDLERVETKIQALLDGDGHGELHDQFEIQHPDGPRHLLVAAALIRDPHLGTRRFVGINADITALIQAQRQLQEQESHLRLVLHSLPNAVFTLGGRDRRIEFVNDEVEAIFGYTPAELIGSETRVLHVDEPAFEAFKARLAQSMARGDSRFRGEELLRRKDGTAIHCEVTVSFDRTHGEVTGMIQSIHSVEDRWRAEQTLRDRQQQWDRFAEATNTAMWNCDLLTGFTERNVGFQSAFGYPAAEVGDSFEWWSERVHDEDRDRILETFARARDSGRETTVYTYRFLRHDGQYVTVRDRLFFLRDEYGAAIRALGAMADITEVVQHEEQLQRIHNLESLGLLAGGIAHDFNNQLTVLLSASDLLRMDLADRPDLTPILEQLQAALSNSTHLTHQLLTFAKGGAPSQETASIERLIREHVTFALRGSSTQVEFRFEPDLWTVRVDPGQIGQVIQNLVINSQQAMQSGGQITIHAMNSRAADDHPILTPGRYVQLQVMDTGPGIPRDRIHRIFDPYFSTKSTGHGLGLAICHSIVERHGGSIRAEPHPDGAFFVIDLPASDVAEEALPPLPEEHSGSGRVLVVDDICEVREALAAMLRALGYDACTAESPGTARDAIAESLDAGPRLDAVITDLTMPGSEGGLAVLREARRLAPELKIIVASGYANAPVLSNYRDHGFDGRLIKPVHLADMTQVLQDALQG